MVHQRAMIFANGVLPDLRAARALLREGDYVVCADAGARHARALGVIPQCVIGDMDSLSAEEGAWTAQAGIPLLTYPVDKDQTDMELALEHVLTKGVREVVVVAALGARLDQTLGNIALLGDERLADRLCALDDGVERVVLCRTRQEIGGTPGDLVSLLPWGAPVEGIRTTGLRWPLRDETLLPERSRGISNELLGEKAGVSIQSGRLLIVHRRLHSGAAADE